MAASTTSPAAMPPSALKLLLAERLKCAPSEIDKRVAIVMSGGTEGGLSPHLLVFCREPATAPASGPRLAIGVGLTRAFAPEEIGRAPQIAATSEAVDGRHGGCRHRLAGRRAFRPDQMPAAHQGAHRGGGAARRAGRDRGHLPFDGAVARRLGAGRRGGAGRGAGRRRDRGRDLPRLVALSPGSPAPRPASSCCATRSSCWAMQPAGRAIS